MKRTPIHQEREKLLEEEKKKREAEEATLQKKQQKEKLHNELDRKQTERSSALKAAEGLLVEAENKLSAAIKAGDMRQTSVAAGMLEVGRKRIAEANRELTDIADRHKKTKFN